MIFARVVGFGGENLVDVAHVDLLDDHRRVDPESGQPSCRGVVELDLRESRHARCERLGKATDGQRPCHMISPAYTDICRMSSSLGQD